MPERDEEAEIAAERRLRALLGRGSQPPPGEDWQRQTVELDAEGVARGLTQQNGVANASASAAFFRGLGILPFHRRRGIVVNYRDG